MLFADTEKATTPLPLPLVWPVNVIQVAPVVAVQVQPEGAAVDKAARTVTFKNLAPALLAARAGNAGEYEAKLRRFFNLNAQLSWALVLPGILLAPIVVRVLYGREFGATTPIFAVLLLGFPAMALGVAPSNSWSMRATPVCSSPRHRSA